MIWIDWLYFIPKYHSEISSMASLMIPDHFSKFRSFEKLCHRNQVGLGLKYSQFSFPIFPSITLSLVMTPRHVCCSLLMLICIVSTDWSSGIACLFEIWCFYLLTCLWIYFDMLSNFHPWCHVLQILSI